MKHGAHAIVADRPVEEQVKDLAFFDADAVIATGQRTGHAADLDYIRLIKEASHLPTLVGSGVTPENVGDILAVVDGVIVASSLKHDGVWWNAVDPARVAAFIGTPAPVSAPASPIRPKRLMARLEGLRRDRRDAGRAASTDRL